MLVEDELARYADWLAQQVPAVDIDFANDSGLERLVAARVRVRAAPRRRQLARRFLLTAAVVALVGTVAALVAAARDHDTATTLDTSPATTVVVNTTDPPLGVAPVASSRTPAVIDSRITVSPAGPYTAGQSVTVTVPRDMVTDAANDAPAICFAWGANEVCDPTDWQRSGRVSIGETSLTRQHQLPGWVNTPDGLRSCAQVGCRLVVADRDRIFRGTPVLDIEPGPEPKGAASLVVNPDGSLVVTSPGIAPDPSWPAHVAQHPDSADDPNRPLNLSLCVYETGCDNLRGAIPRLPSDGSAFSVTIPARRLLLTSGTRGWADCAKVTCTVEISNVNSVTGVNANVIGTRIVAVLPYRVPTSTPGDTPPTITIEPAGPYRNGQTVTVTLRDAPAAASPQDGQLKFAQCPGPAGSSRVACAYRGGLTWTRIDATTYTTSFVVSSSPLAHLAWLPGGQGDPPGATSGTFEVVA